MANSGSAAFTFCSSPSLLRIYRNRLPTTASSVAASSSSVVSPPQQPQTTALPVALSPSTSNGSQSQTNSRPSRRLSLQDYFDVSTELVISSKDGGPPRWFSPLECGARMKDSPLLLFLPGSNFLLPDGRF